MALDGHLPRAESESIKDADTPMRKHCKEYH